MSCSAPTLLVQHLNLRLPKVTHSSFNVFFMWLMRERYGVRVADGAYNCTDGTVVPKDVKHP